MRVIIIGGGAAGFFAAITCAQEPDTEVMVLEAGREFLTKVRISGGGRCNVTHHCFDPAQLVQFYPRGGKALRGAFTKFNPQDTVVWFAKRGVKLKTEADGRMFPITDDSETIVNCLLQSAKTAGVKLLPNTPVQKVDTQGDKYIVSLKKGESLECDRVLIATGSNPAGYRIAASLGHSIITPVPSLFTFQIRDDRLKDLAGVSVSKASAIIPSKGKEKLQQMGPLLITHWGMSGPAILKLSAHAARVLYENSYRMSLIVNWLGDSNPEKVRQILLENKASQAKRKIFNYCPFDIPKRLWHNLLIHVGIDSETIWTQLSKNHVQVLTRELTGGQYEIKGKGVFKEEFVTCGGIALKEVDFKTMESKCCPGLHFAGEILDIDGVTGGFNFQSAWTTGYLAGEAMRKSLPLADPTGMKTN